MKIEILNYKRKTFIAKGKYGKRHVDKSIQLIKLVRNLKDKTSKILYTHNKQLGYTKQKGTKI